MMKLPLDAELLIPHRKPMRVIDRLNSSDGESGTAETLFDFDSPFVVDSSGKIERLALIEFIAQTYAAAKGHEDLSFGKSLSDGYLVGISHAYFHGDAYAGEKLFVKVRTKDSFDNFFITTGEVFQHEKLLLEASLTILINPESNQPI
jgi:predicted hotdog family 3-hydroxylacyl-ACP dehydratase